MLPQGISCHLQIVDIYLCTQYCFQIEHKGDMRTAEAKLVRCWHFSHLDTMIMFGLIYIYIQRPSPDETKFTRDFKIISRLGKGGYGVVYRVKKHFDEGDYAIKIIKLNPQRYI